MPQLSTTQVAYLRQLFAQAGTGLIPGTWLTPGTLLYSAAAPDEFAQYVEDVEHVEAGFSGTVVTLPSVPLAGRRLDVFVNGVLSRAPAHYSVSGDTVTFTSPIEGEADVVVKYVTEPV